MAGFNGIAKIIPPGHIIWKPFGNVSKYTKLCNHFQCSKDSLEPEAHGKEPRTYMKLKLNIIYHDNAQFYSQNDLERYWDFRYITPKYSE